MLPLPAVMLSCQLPGKTPNIITLSWVGVLASNPPQVGVGITPQRFSHHIVDESGEFVINIPSEDQMGATDFCGHVSGRQSNKFKHLGLTAGECKKVSAPMIAECPVNLECVVRAKHNLGSHDLFIGEIVAMHATDECVDSKGRIDIQKVRPFTYVPMTRDYIGNLTTVIGKAGSSVIKK